MVEEKLQQKSVTVMLVKLLHGGLRAHAYKDIKVGTVADGEYRPYPGATHFQQKCEVSSVKFSDMCIKKLEIWNSM